MASQYSDRSLGLSPDGSEAQKLIARYPDLSETELTRLIETCAKLPFIDFSVLAADQRYGSKFAKFYDDHGAKLRQPIIGWVGTFASVAVIAIALVLWAMS